MRRLLLAALISSALIIAIARFASADIVGDPALLDEAIRAHEHNVAELRTWDARLEVRDTRRENADSNAWTNDVTFAYDRERGASIFVWRCAESQGLRDGKSYPGYNDGTEDGELVVDGKLYTLRFWPGPNSIRTVSVGRLVPFVPRQAVGSAELRIVPEQLFWHGGKPLKTRFEQYKTAALGRGDFQLEVRREGDLIKVNTQSSQNVRVLRDELAIDIAKGGMVVSAFSSVGDERTDKWQTDVEQQNGIWIPEKRVYAYVGKAPARTAATIERTMVWKSNHVNDPLDPSRFSVRSLTGGNEALLSDPLKRTQERIGANSP